MVGRDIRINVIEPSVLNDSDNELIEFCYENPRSVGELSKLLDIALKNVISKLEKLEKNNFIKINRQGRGKKTIIEANKNNRTVKNIHDNKIFERFLNHPKTSQKTKDRIMDIITSPK